MPSEWSPSVNGRRRVVVEDVNPRVDCGEFPAKRVVGDVVEVTADAFGDGHDLVRAVLRSRQAGDSTWVESPMEPLGNDAWRGTFTVGQPGIYEFTVAAATDHWATWRHDLATRIEAGQDVSVDLLIGANLVAEAAVRTTGPDAVVLSDAALRLRADTATAERTRLALDDALDAAMRRNHDRSSETVAPVLQVSVDPVLARFSSWYELFPRSASPEAGRHGTFADVIERLPYVAGMGFDVLYLPPIHPVGSTFRKGPNNVTTASEGDPGVPWAIGSAAGGHMAVHPELGSIEDFRKLVQAAEEMGIAVALDIAFQASPDHPAVQEHPEWFRKRPDGTVQYAENPPKKYQDIYPFDFESDDWPGLWAYLRDIIEYWIGEGVRIFRVDNPHTKAFSFWEWLIAEVKRDRPDVLFLAEAFTRPKVMYRLAKVGFDQSYTYFTWRTGKAEIIEYFTELTRGPTKEYFRPNVWPNTPDILHEFLQKGGRPAFEIRFVLAATLAASYGIYGPAFETGEHVPLREGSEEYLRSEKYEIRHWDLDRPDSLAPLITRVNRIRHEHPALQANDSLAFHEVQDENLLAYSKRSPDGSDIVLTVVNLDPHAPHAAYMNLPLWEWGISEEQPYTVEDLVTGAKEEWQGAWNRIELDPASQSARILLVHGGRR